MHTEGDEEKASGHGGGRGQHEKNGCTSTEAMSRAIRSGRNHDVSATADEAICKSDFSVL